MPPLSMGGSNIRSASGFGASARRGWGLQSVRAGGPGQTITIQEARRRIRKLRLNVRKNAARMLMAAAQPLVDQWKDNIAAEGWAGSGLDIGGIFDDEEAAETRRSGYTLEEAGEGEAGSTGRYYDSIKSEVDSDLEVHVGSTIPRPSGRGLKTWSYPEALEYGTSRAQAYPTLRPALDMAGPEMERESKRLFDQFLAATLMERFTIPGNEL